MSYAFADLKRDLVDDIVGHARHGANFYSERVSVLRKLSILSMPPMLCTLLFRLSHWAWGHGWHGLAWALCHLNQMVHGAALHPASRVGGGLYIPHTVGVIFEGHAGRNLVLFANAVVANGHHHPKAWDGGDGAPRLGDDVTVGAYVVVSGGLQVGNRVRIAPCATLHRDVEDDCMVIGSSRSRIRNPEAGALRHG